MDNFEFYTKPFDHQKKEFESSHDKKAFAILWDVGCGKSKLICDQFVSLWQTGKVNSLLIVAPNGVQRAWASDQLKTHCDPAHGVISFVWNGSKANTAKFKSDFSKFLKSNRPSVLLINYEAIRTKNGYYACEQFLKSRPCMMVCDESHRIKSPKALQTKCILKLGQLATYRRILSGTPVGNSAFDIYTQFKFLDPKILGFKSWYAFRNYFGVFEKKFVGRWVNLLKEYRRLDELQKLIKNHSSRVLKTDVLDLPERLYVKRYYEMTPKQATIYKELRDEYMVELSDGKELSAPLALVRLLRLQQILCGYLPIEKKNVRIPDNKTNPRIECLREILEDYEDSKIIIWCRFTEDIKQVCELLGSGYVSYFGETSNDDRERAIEKFTNDPSVKYFVSNEQCGGTGQNLQVANICIYYSNTFSLIDRSQSEGRIHRSGQKRNCLYIDIVCQNTVDEHIIDSLRNHFNIAQAINGDTLRGWI